MIKLRIGIWFVWVCLVFSGCSNKDVDSDIVQNIIDFAKGDIGPNELLFDPDSLVSKSRLYSGAVASYLGLPEDFDLNLLMGKLLYQWGEFSDASIYLNNARKTNDPEFAVVATDFYLFCSTLAGRGEVIEDLKGENINSMLSKEVWAGLADGVCDNLDQAVIDVGISSKGNLINRSMQYLEFLSRWVSMYCDSSYASFYERQILDPALNAVTAGEDWIAFVAAARAGNIRPIQQVLIGDFYSISDSAVRFGIKTGNFEMAQKWAALKEDLKLVAGANNDLYSRVSRRES